MFKYDSTYVQENIDIANDFLGSFIWRFLLLCIVMNILMVGILFLLFGSFDFMPYIFFTAIPGVVIAAYFAFKLLLKVEHKGKCMQLRYAEHEPSSLRNGLIWVSVGFVLRVYMVSAFHHLVGIISGFYLIDYIPDVVVGFLCAMLGWWWFALLNSKKGWHIEFIVKE